MEHVFSFDRVEHAAPEFMSAGKANIMVRIELFHTLKPADGVELMDLVLMAVASQLREQGWQ